MNHRLSFGLLLNHLQPSTQPDERTPLAGVSLARPSPVRISTIPSGECRRLNVSNLVGYHETAGCNALGGFGSLMLTQSQVMRAGAPLPCLGGSKRCQLTERMLSLTIPEHKIPLVCSIFRYVAAGQPSMHCPDLVHPNRRNSGIQLSLNGVWVYNDLSILETGVLRLQNCSFLVDLKEVVDR